MADSSRYDPRAFRDHEQQGWGEVSGTYHDTFGQLTGQTVASLIEGAEAGEGRLLLDLACGTGRAATAAHELGARVVGLDFVASMVGNARRRSPGVAFGVGDAQQLPLAAARFDGIFSNFGWRHFTHPDRAMAEAFRILKPGGRFAMTDWMAPGPLGVVVREALAEHGSRDVVSPPSGPAIDLADPAVCRALLTAEGFADVESREVPVLGRWPRAEGVLDTIAEGMVNTRAGLDAQPPERRERINAAILAHAKRFEVDGEIRIPAKAMLTTARKP